MKNKTILSLRVEGWNDCEIFSKQPPQSMEIVGNKITSVIYGWGWMVGERATFAIYWDWLKMELDSLLNIKQSRVL